MGPELLPLFPLEVVLLPQSALPLHIFEERYKLLIGEAIEQRSEFGVVLAKENALANVGCTAVVERVTRRYEDGRLDILTRGERRFEILLLDEKKPYLRAGVHFFGDDGRPATPEAVRRLGAAFEKALHLLSAATPQRPAPGERLTSFQVAGALPIDLDVKQRILALRSEAERTDVLCEFLEGYLPRLERARRLEAAARGNGHG